MDFKYKAKFETLARVSLGNFAKINENKLLSKASLDDLKALLPDSETVEDNPDLLYTAFNAAVVNLINANDHGMATDTALSIARYFKDRHMNIEHDRYRVIGHIMNYGFSTFDESKIFEPAADTKEPFNLCLAAIVYRVVDEWISDMIEESADPKSYMYKEISASWEIGYDEYDIVLGSKKLSDAEIITDESKREELSQYLRLMGGDGFMPDGTPVYALITGNARPLGCAFTFSPAAAVKGLITAEVESCPVEVHLSEDLKKEIKDSVESGIKTALSEKKNLKKQNTGVIHDMKLTAIEDITADYLHEAQASEVTSFIREQINKVSNEFSEKLKASEEEKETLQTSLAEVQKLKEDLEGNVKTLQGEVANLKASIEAKEQEDTFNLRMSEITEKYDLSDEQRKVVANQIRELSDEGFSKWMGEFELFATKKEAPEPNHAAQALDKIKKDGILPPNGQGGEEDELARAINSFSKGLKIQAR